VCEVVLFANVLRRYAGKKMRKTQGMGKREAHLQCSHGRELGSPSRSPGTNMAVPSTWR
jgi:hypothetical protein